MCRPGLTLLPLFAIVNHASKTEGLTTHATKDVPTMPHIHLNTIRDGYALVYRDSTILGRIKRITWPHQQHSPRGQSTPGSHHRGGVNPTTHEMHSCTYISASPWRSQPHQTAGEWPPPTPAHMQPWRSQSSHTLT